MEFIQVPAGTFMMGTKSQVKILAKDIDKIDDLTLAREDESFVEKLRLPNHFMWANMKLPKGNGNLLWGQMFDSCAIGNTRIIKRTLTNIYRV